jgi:hypothetical protein
MMRTEAGERPASATAIAGELRALAAGGGLGDPAKELAEYFADSDAFVRTRGPAIVGAIMAAASRAIAESKLPRALALADRAYAMAPDDPAVAALVATVTEGGHSARRRRRLVAVAAAGVVLAGGATAAVFALRGGGDEIAAVVRDAALGSDARVLDAAPDAMLEVTPDAAPPLIDAGVVRDAGRARRLDAAVVVVPLATDASVQPMIPDAAPLLPAADAAAARVPGAIVVDNDTWCDVTIDGAKHRLREPVSIDAGPHHVICEQTGSANKWERDVQVVAGETKRVAGTMLGAIDVTFGIDATIDGVPYKRGKVAHLKARHVHVVAGDRSSWLDLPGACTLTPDLECNPPLR